MHRTSNAFSVLQATAAIVALAIILWSVGLPSFRIAEAANVTSVSDTLSTSEPGVDADHEIVFTTPTGVLNTEEITVSFADGPFVINAVTFNDIDVSTTSGSFSLAADCTGSEMASAAFSGTTLTITMCLNDGGLIAPNGTTTILIGENAGGTDQLTNPALGVYDIEITAGSGADTGETSVAIVSTVTVTASVDTYFTFTVAGTAFGTSVNGTTTGGVTTGTAIPLGVLNPATGVASTAAQLLDIDTNARNGFTVTVTADGQLRSSNLADIDGFSNGTYITSPSAWVAPSASLGSENTYGHWGITSNDTDVFASSQTFVSASTSPVEVWTHNGPANGTTAGVGQALVGYTVQVSALQEAAEDYQAILTYVATPVF